MQGFIISLLQNTFLYRTMIGYSIKNVFILQQERLSILPTNIIYGFVSDRSSDIRAHTAMWNIVYVGYQINHHSRYDIFSSMVITHNAKSNAMHQPSMLLIKLHNKAMVVRISLH